MVLRATWKRRFAPARLEPSGILGSVTHDLRGRDTRAWRTFVPHYGRLTATNVQPGIDVVHYVRDGAWEHDYLLAPGADARQLRWRIAGAESLRVNQRGDLLLSTAAGVLRWHQPVAYQEADGASTLR